MRKLFISAFFLLCLQDLLSAQNFVPLGATWHYSGAEFSPFWERSTYEKDTLLDGRSQMKISVLRQSFGWMGTGTPWIPGPPEYYTRYFYQSADTVYERQQNGIYRILFVFNVPVGDSWETWPPFEENPGCIVYSRTQVLDTGTVQINGKTLRYWDIGPTDSSFIAMEGRIIEQIGPTGRGWYSKVYSSTESNHCAQGIYENMISAFTCFESDSIGAYRSEALHYGQCEYYLSSPPEDIPEDIMLLYPNPVREVFYMYMRKGSYCDLDILDMQGHLLKSLSHKTAGDAISLEGYGAGIYLVRLRRPGQPAVLRKLIKN